ncbi:DUF1758 domain-containing protein [Trichonephila clavipes]|nr:DUF1758 domain-containing protein [Trichonephila clavipes]
MMWTTPELAPPSPNYHTTPHQRENVSALDRFNVHRCPTWRVFSGTGLELMTRQATVRYLYHSTIAATFVLLYIKEEELNDYEKLKSIVLKNSKTPRECLNSFKNAVKSSGETYIQFAARLTANFQYYCSLRKVNSFESLCDLIISDKLFETLNKETATHIGIREAEDWFRPIDLAKECDIYISSRSGSHKEIPTTYGYTQDPFKNKSQNFKTKIKENYPQYLEKEKIKIAIYAVSISLRKRLQWCHENEFLEFISQSPTPSPMNSKHHRFVLLRRSLSLGSGNEKKLREIVSNRRPELYRGKYRCVQPKINLLKKIFSSGLHGSTAADSVRSEWPLWQQPKAKHSLRAQAQLMRTETVETFELVKVKQKLLDIRVERKENARGA